MKINTNIPAQKVLAQLTRTNSSLDKAIERLSSGKKINRAADNAAGLAISQKMRTQVKGLEIASRNSMDGISLIQTAEGAHDVVQSMLQRSRELAVQASNGTMAQEDREAVQAEIVNLKEEINRISTSIDYNGMVLLDGSIDNAVFSSDDTIAEVVSMSNTVPGGEYTFEIEKKASKTMALGGEVNGLFDEDSKAKFGGQIAINGTTVDIAAGESAEEVFSKIRDTADIAGVNIVSQAPFNEGSYLTVENKFYGEKELNIEGDIGLLRSLGLDEKQLKTDSEEVYYQKETLAAATSDEKFCINNYEVNIKAGETPEEIVKKVNNLKIPGVYLEIDAPGGSEVTVWSTEAPRIDPATGLFGSFNGVIDANGNVTSPVALSDSTTPSKVDAPLRGNKGMNVVVAGWSNDDMSTAKIEGFPAGTTAVAKGDKILFEGPDGFELLVEGQINAGEVVLNILDAGALDLQIGANEGQMMGVRIPNMNTKALGIEELTMTTGEFAQDGIGILDEAISRVSEVRARLGAFQNRLDHTVNSLSVARENMTASLSRIEDADMAEEMAEYTKLNVLSQAGVSVLAQANQRPQSILQLLNK